MKMKKGNNGGGGEIVEVEGGHILRSTARKDRHSKVCTAKGPRDRRVRLSPHTAIQFYDVQDRLGYDRPSKALDWLITKAKSAIDNLAELPPWNPQSRILLDSGEGPSRIGMEEKSNSSDCEFQMQGNPQFGGNRNSGPSLLPPYAETSSSMDFLSRNAIQTEDLCLSLQSLQDSNPNNNPNHPSHHTLFSGPAASLNFEPNYQKLEGWNGGGGDAEARQGYIFSSMTMPQQQQQQPPLLCHSSAFTQREPLQSSFTPLFRAWSDHTISSPEQQSLIYRGQFGSEGSSRLQVHAPVHGGDDDNPFSASP